MMSYDFLKQKLKKNHVSTKYFTKEFYDIFIEDYKNAKIGCNSNYEDTKNTDFYNKSGCSYCKFLEVFYNSLKMYKIDYFINETNVKTLFTREDEEKLKEIAEYNLPEGVDHYTIELA